MDGLETFFPEPRQLHGVMILPVRMRQLPRFARAVTPIWDLVMREAWWEIATERYDEAVAAVVAATEGTSAEQLGELFPDQFFEVAQTVFEVNLDFFGRRLLPMVREAVARHRPGAPSSPPLPDAASASMPAQT